MEEATKQKDILAIEQLLYDSTAEDLHIVDEENQSPIFWAINSDSLKIGKEKIFFLKTLSLFFFYKVNLFIESYRKLNLDINSRDRHGWTILVTSKFFILKNWNVHNFFFKSISPSRNVQKVHMNLL